MDNDTLPSSPADAGLPKATPFAARKPVAPDEARDASALVAAGPTAVAEQNDRSGVFGQLVQGDSDIAGLVAYSIYKQNKLDWRRAFEAAKGRAPTEDEIAAYIIGEGTTRRLATYRHLAEATLAGNGPDVDGTRGAGPTPSGRRLGGADVKTLTNGLMITYGLIALLFVIVLWFAVHLTH